MECFLIDKTAKFFLSFENTEIEVPRLKRRLGNQMTMGPEIFPATSQQLFLEQERGRTNSRPGWKRKD